MHTPANTATPGGRHDRNRARTLLRGYTLVELLVVLFLITVLIAVLVPSLVNARQAARTIVCMDHNRSAAMEFQYFADPYAHPDRGDSERYDSQFDAMDFLESLYKVGEFWDSYGVDQLTYRSGRDLVTCPSAPAGLIANGSPATLWQPSVSPRENVSYAMNRRLFRAPALKEGVPWEGPVLLTDHVLNDPHVPLLFDVDARAAMKHHGQTRVHYMPFFCTPDPFVDDYWFPAMRHRGRMIVSFVGGHVLSTKAPLSEPQWNWDYFPSLGSNVR